MRFKALVLAALLLCPLFSYACAGGGMPSFPAVVHTPTPLSAWDEEGGLSALAAGTANAPERSLTGVVLYRDKENIVLSADGATISVPAAYVSDVMLGPGDIATLSYNGMIAYQPQFNSVQKIGSSVISDTVFGEVSGMEDDVLHVSIESGELYSFTLDKRTVFHGGDKESFRAGDAVMVIFEGKLAEEPKALDVTMLILDGAPTPMNRSIAGVVSALDDSQITLIADDNASYTFLRNFATEVDDPSALRAGARVRVTYDGYAAQSPLAKEIEVLKVYATPRPAGGSGMGEAALSWLPTRTTNPMAGMPFSYIYYASYQPPVVINTCRDCGTTTTPSTGTGSGTGTGGGTGTGTGTGTGSGAGSGTGTGGGTGTGSGAGNDTGGGSDTGSGTVQPQPQRDSRIAALLNHMNTVRQLHFGSDGSLPEQWNLYENPYGMADASYKAYQIALAELYIPSDNELIAKIPRNESGPEPFQTYVQAVSLWMMDSRDRGLLLDPLRDWVAIGVYSDADNDYYYVEITE